MTGADLRERIFFYDGCLGRESFQEVSQEVAKGSCLEHYVQEFAVMIPIPSVIRKIIGIVDK
jgi:hypothetical protein